MTHPAPEGRQIDFLLVENFSMVGFLCALSAFRIANEVSGRAFYRTRIAAPTGAAVTASIGITVAPEGVTGPDDRPDLVFVCAGNGPQERYTKAIGAWLRRVERRGAVMAAISTGTDLLARAGLLDGYQCTIYWEQADAFAEEFPEAELTGRIYEIDRNRLTCGGATSSIDLCLHLIAADLGREVAASVSAAFLLDRVREAGELQKHAPSVGAQPVPARLARAIALMEANLEAPLPLAEIAAQAGLGERQLRRLFHGTLNVAPKAYYLLLRLARARALVSQTDLPLQEVAGLCGFGSASAFASAYRQRYGVPPRRERGRVL